MSLQPVLLGRVAGVFAVHGWLKIISYTTPRQRIADYKYWLLETDGWQSFAVAHVRRDKKRLLARLHGVTDRSLAYQLVGANVAVDEKQLPPLPDGEVYWRQMIGLSVVNQQGEVLGRVHSLLATGAHDVVDVRCEQGRYLIPFVRPIYIKGLDLQAGRLSVDWHREWS